MKNAKNRDTIKILKIMGQVTDMNPERLTQSEDKLILVNIVEELVRAKVSSTIQFIDMCRCEKCQLNACAIALNELPPKYVTTTKGALFAQLGVSGFEDQTAIEVEVMKALKIVKECPMH